MAVLDAKKINGDDFEYCTQIYSDYLKSFNNSTSNGQIKYYYQYEFDSSTTFYESLMRQHLITISAQSYEEAMLCNVILRCLFDGHFGGMCNYIEHDKKFKPIPNSNVDKYFNNIKESDTLSQYKNFCKNDPVSIEPGNKEIYNSTKLNILCKKERIYNKDNIINLLNDLFIKDNFSDHEARIQYILSIGL